MVPAIGAILSIGSTLIDRLIPDPTQKAAAQAELIRLAQSGDLAQIEVNRVEAASENTFVSGWRPFIGWVCGWGCAWNWIGLPVVVTLTTIGGKSFNLHPADLSEMMPLLLGMLGMGGLRTVEKLKGVAAK